MKNKTDRRMSVSIVFSGVCLGLCFLLPYLTGQIPTIGQALSPMHIPVFICGFTCGWPYGMLIGFIAPILRSLFFTMPPMYPVAIAMAFELAAYGAFSGLLYRILPKKKGYIYLTLISSMIIGRIVWGLVRAIMAGLGGSEFTMGLFISGAFVSAIPGIICHIILVPLVIMALERAGIINDEKNGRYNNKKYKKISADAAR